MADLRSGLGYLSFERIQPGLQRFDLGLARLQQFFELFVLLLSLPHFSLETHERLRHRRPERRLSRYAGRGRS
jgi:hypothetical protein